MKHQYSLKNRALAMLLCGVMVLGMFPANVVAEAGPSKLNTTIGNTDFVVGKSQEFTVTSTANDDVGTQVIATFTFSDGSVIEQLEYYETAEGMQGWRPLPGNEFGPATGFPLSDATSRFRVTFNKAGTYTVKIALENVNDRSQILCSATETVTVFKANAGKVTTDIGSKRFYSGLAQEFTLDSIANGDAGTMVLGHFEFSDPDAVSKLEYYETNAAKGTGWHELTGNDYGSAGGFPMEDASIRFRVTFNRPGTHLVTVSAIKAADRTVVARTTQTIVVAPLATVGGYTGGTVSGNASTDVALTVDTATLEWSPADAGKNEDSWWAGMKVEAPAGMSAAQLQDAKYQSKDASGDAWGNVKSFWSDKNSANDAQNHYMDVWMSIKPETVETAKAEGVNITRYCRFDWDNDGVYEQQILFSVNPNGVTLNKKDQIGFSFQNTTPADMWVGEGSYQNEAVGGQGDGAVTYEIIDGGAYATISANGTVTFGDLGDNDKVVLTVRATKAADSSGVYKEATAQYSLTVYRKVQVPQFTSSNPSVMTYAPDAYLDNPLMNPEELKGEVTYEVTSGQDVGTVDNNGRLTILKAGTVTVTATVAGDGEYQPAQVSYTLLIEKAPQTGFTFAESAPQNISYNDGGNKYTNPVVNGLGEGEVVYSIASGSEVASINAATGELTILKAGIVVVQAQKAGDDCYQDSAVVTYTLEILPDTQDGFGFENPTPAQITYNDNGNRFQNPVVNAKGDGELVYSVTVGSDVAKINPVTGELTILKAGEVVVKAEKAGDEQYTAASATYRLTIVKDNQTISFEDAAVDKFYGITEYTNETLVSSDLHGDGEIVYEIVGENEIGAVLDSATGRLSFEDSVGKIGGITVKATRAADECYNECSAQYTFTLAYLPAPADPYTLSGNTMNDSGWYTGAVTISAPDGYQISYRNDLSNAAWSESVIYDTEGADQETTVYLRDADGRITDGIAVTGISIDTVNPGDLRIDYAKPTWEVILEKVSFGLYQADELTVTVSAVDNTSGIASLTYNTGSGDVSVPVSGTQSASHSFTIKAQYRGKITLTATDVAGLQTKQEDDTVLVLDTKNPDITAEYEFVSGNHREDDGKIYTQQDVIITLVIDETNFDLSGLEILNDPEGSRTAAPVVKVNSVETPVSWNKNTETGKWEGEVTLSGNGDYIVTADYTDPVGKVMETYEKEIHIDDTAPVISVSYDNTSATNENCYNADRTATVAITAHNFKAKDVEVTVKAKDITDEPVSVADYAAYAKDSNNWSKDGDVWTLNPEGMKFDVDAIYSVGISYADLNGNAAETVTSDFVIDKTEPDESKIHITYSTSLVDKILEKVSFGFYQPDVTVTITAEDMTSGVDYFEVYYNQVDGANTTNKPSYKTERIPAVQDDSNKNIFTATHTITAEARGTVSVDVTDRAGWIATKADGKNLVVDSIAPGLDVKYIFANGQNREYEDIYYTQGKTTLRFTIDEANFDLALLTAEGEEKNAAPVVTINDVPQNVTWTQTEGTNQWVGEVTLSGNGDYVVAMTFADRSGNPMESFRKEIHIDNAAPEFAVTYDNNGARNENCYNADRTAEIQITEHNFNPSEVKLTVTATDILNNPVDISQKAYADYAKNPDNWTSSGDVWTLNTAGMGFDTDAIYAVKLEYTDLAENAANVYTADFVIDKTDADNITIEYSESIVDRILSGLTYGLYQPEVTVTVTAEDMTAGVEAFQLTYTRQENVSGINRETFTTEPLEAVQSGENPNVFTATYKIPAQARGTVSAEVTDRAGNDSTGENPDVVVVDDVAPTREVIYTPYKILDRETMLEVEEYQEGDDAILYYQNEAAVTFKINEANFDLSLLNEEDKPVIKVNETPVDVEWTQDGDVWTAVYTIVGDGDYVVAMSYKDLSNNEMVSYESCKIVVDGTAPVVEVKYLDGEPTQILDGVKYYKNTQTVSVQITDHNFRADDVELTVTAKDIQENTVDISQKAYADYAKNLDNWTSDGDVHTLNLDGMVFDTDAIYTFDIVYDDINDNYAADYEMDTFVVDHKSPENLTISYSTPVIEKVIEALTFGFYKADLVITIACDDITSGVDFIEWTYTKEEGTSDVNAESYGGTIESKDITYSEKNKSASATVTIPANARGFVTASVVDRAGNSSHRNDNTRINVVDTIAPEISVVYTPDSDNTKVQFVDGNKMTVDSFDKATDALYNGDVTATIVIDEANFFEGQEASDGVIHQVGIKLTKTDNAGNVTVTEYLPAGAEQRYAGAEAEYIAWTTEGDRHTISISYAEDADYVLKITFTDLCTNEANISSNDGQNATKTYTSKVVTVDKIAPVVEVEYGNTQVVNTISGRKYFDTSQSATITVTEHNFRAADVMAAVTAVDFLNDPVAVADFAAQLADERNWTHQGNVHTANVSYTADANYTFDIDIMDLAKNASADYTQDLFTVDTTVPTNLTVSYSTNVFQEILESITFGYYNATMTVTITADDSTTGIHHFLYSYINSEGVSQVNAELLNQAISAAEIKHNGKTAVATFQIPKMVLGNDNQFNGTVQFTAYDRSKNSTELKDTTRIVVDNISPTATITYNAPVQEANNISYYAGNIEATIAINEANFNSEDVVVTVTKDGVNYPVRVTWRDNSVDNHVGSFVLAEDGDYIVSVRYKDRSGNQMTDYQSNQLTLDTTAPVIQVSNIQANSANKDKVYGFEIEFSDTNLDASAMKPVLKAVVEKADGVYEIVEIDLGDAQTVVDGQTYRYNVENLPEDGLYTLTCKVKDMAGNGTTQVVLDDGQSYEQVQFSINRNGSMFGYGSEFTEKLVNQYYVYSVEEDIVIFEVNVDPIEDYTVLLNGKKLVEGTDYTSEQTSNKGEWSKRTYTIRKDLFTAEGEYSIVVTSTDKTNTTAFSDVKKLAMAFVVDQTAPVLTITGLEAGGRYQSNEQTVTVIPTDEGGRLNRLCVIVLDSNGNPLKDKDTGKDISVRFDMSGEELLKYLQENDGKVTFTVPEGLNNKVKIVCNDCAVNGDNLTNEYNELFENVTVSQSWFIIFYANKPAFFGTIGGVICIAILVAFLIGRKKSSKAKK